MGLSEAKTSNSIRNEPSNDANKVGNPTATNLDDKPLKNPERSKTAEGIEHSFLGSKTLGKTAALTAQSANAKKKSGENTAASGQITNNSAAEKTADLAAGASQNYKTSQIPPNPEQFRDGFNNQFLKKEETKPDLATKIDLAKFVPLDNKNEKSEVESTDKTSLENSDIGLETTTNPKEQFSEELDKYWKELTRNAKSEPLAAEKNVAKTLMKGKEIDKYLLGEVSKCYLYSSNAVFMGEAPLPVKSKGFFFIHQQFINAFQDILNRVENAKKTGSEATISNFEQQKQNMNVFSDDLKHLSQTFAVPYPESRAVNPLLNANQKTAITTEWLDVKINEMSEFFIGENTLKALNQQFLDSTKLQNAKKEIKEQGGLFYLDSNSKELKLEECETCEQTATAMSTPAYNAGYYENKEKNYLGGWHTHPRQKDVNDNSTTNIDGKVLPSTVAPSQPDCLGAKNGQNSNTKNERPFYRLVGGLNVIATEHGITIFRGQGTSQYEDINRDGSVEQTNTNLILNPVKNGNLPENEYELMFHSPFFGSERLTTRQQYEFLEWQKHRKFKKGWDMNDSDLRNSAGDAIHTFDEPVGLTKFQVYDWKNMQKE